tara:strand:- start:6122 stop:6658 length:537 start_codon:yes stop_codon:yes gene_type:complete
MSRVGKQPIEILEGVEVTVEGQKVAVKGPKGELSLEVHPAVAVHKEGKIVTVSADNKALWGLFRSLLFNMVVGVAKGYEKRLELQGTGYRAGVEGDSLKLNLGFSHEITRKIPEGLNCAVEKNIIIISGIDKQAVGEFAARIRKLRPPEPYKGKGVRYEGERVRRKEGKKAATTAGGA